MIYIVGAGLAGLYAGWRLESLGYAVSIHEASHRIGGRVGTLEFAGRHVPIGAGVGRKAKDRLLHRLCADLHVHVIDYTTQIRYNPLQPVDLIRTMRRLRTAYTPQTSNARATETLRSLQLVWPSGVWDTRRLYESFGKKKTFTRTCHPEPRLYAPKRIFWKTEQEVGRVFSMYFARVRGPN